MKIKLLLILLFAALFSHAQRISVYFETGKADIPDSSFQRLKLFADQYNNCNYNFRIEGYTDGVGKEEDNHRLSLLRVEVVHLVLKNLEVLQDIVTESFGEKEAIANGDEKPNKLYRRVDVIAETRVCEKQPEGNIADLYRQLQDNGQEFCINPDRDTALVGKNGTIVYYKQGTFKNITGCKCLRLVLHEFYKKSELIMNNLTTTSDGRPLESGGMTKLEVFAEQIHCNTTKENF